MTLRLQFHFGLLAERLFFYGWWKRFVLLSTIRRKKTAVFLYGFYRRRLIYCFKHWSSVLKLSSQSALAGNNAVAFWDEKSLSQSFNSLSLNKQTVLDRTDADCRSNLRWKNRQFHYFQRQLRVVSQTKVKLLAAFRFFEVNCLIAALDSWKFNLTHPDSDPKLPVRFILKKYWATWTNWVKIAHRADLACTWDLRCSLKLWVHYRKKLADHVKSEIMSLDRLLLDDNGRFGAVFRSSNNLTNLRTMVVFVCGGSFFAAAAAALRFA